jgi:hypothetical protein
MAPVQGFLQRASNFHTSLVVDRLYGTLHAVQDGTRVQLEVSCELTNLDTSIVVPVKRAEQSVQVRCCGKHLVLGEGLLQIHHADVTIAIHIQSLKHLGRHDLSPMSGLNLGDGIVETFHHTSSMPIILISGYLVVRRPLPRRTVAPESPIQAVVHCVHIPPLVDWSIDVGDELVDINLMILAGALCGNVRLDIRFDEHEGSRSRTVVHFLTKGLARRARVIPNCGFWRWLLNRLRIQRQNVCPP